MEFLDIVDKNDKIIGQATKEEVYRKLYTHRIVHVLIFNDKGEFVLQLRSKNVPFCPLHWSTAVGGHVRSGESYEDAAKREYKEELGTTSKLFFFSKDFYQVPNGTGKFLVTFKTAYNGPFDIDSKAVDKIGFFNIEEIKKMINKGENFHPELLFLLKKHFL
jgi:isopentenyldiphosphate isomerase